MSRASGKTRFGFQRKIAKHFCSKWTANRADGFEKGLHYVWHVATDAAARETSLLVQKQSFEVHTSFVEDPRSLAVAA